MADAAPLHKGYLHSLHDLAMDLHWSWNHATDKIWKQLDPELWERTHNPLVVLQTVSRNRIRQMLGDPIVRDTIDELMEEKLQRSVAPAWFQNEYPASAHAHIVYFSMEYMLSEALSIYSGGLGNVSGDLLKTASDLGVPVTGIGLLYQQGYARQMIFNDGTQQYVAPYNDPGQLPVTPVRGSDGEWLRIRIQLPGTALWLRTWKVQVGRVQLLLLDSNDAANCPMHRGITNELYGSDPEFRLLQEIILGIGGWRLVEALHINPQVIHLNEGHSAFAVLERARFLMEQQTLTFGLALHVTRAGNIFTTHTAIGAGFDHFEPALIEKYLGSYIRNELRISLRDFLALGRQNMNDDTEWFNTAYLAIRGSCFLNGVSRLHAQVSKQLFSSLFPGWPIDEVPIGFVTNGVHIPSWDSPEADKVWTEACGKQRWLGLTDTIGQKIHAVSDERLWTLRTVRSKELVEDVRAHYRRQLEISGGSASAIEKVRDIFDPSIFTMGFARRFVPYKRPDLLLRDKERLRRILFNKERPTQLVIAGKAHPLDRQSQEKIREWIRFINENDAGNRVVFLSDNDMLLTEQLVQGVDLWINTPRRPWEACGTSGMKVLVNGGLNVSELDGWWDEAYTPEVGWTFGDRQPIADDEAHDRDDAERLYDLLEQEIIPLFYKRSEQGMPLTWIGLMRNSMSRLTYTCSSVRSLQEYTRAYYLPAFSAYQHRLANMDEGRKAALWTGYFRDHIRGVQFGAPACEKAGETYQYSVPITLNGLDPADISVELYADAGDGMPAVKKPMQASGSKANGALLFTTTVPADRPAAYYTPRLIPADPSIFVPLECNCIAWQR